MDKSTLSNYGWVVIVTLVLSVMLALATPFGGYVGRAVSNVVKYYKTVTGDTFNADYIEKQGEEWDDFLNDIPPEIPPENIESDDHIYGIGKTKSEYVLAIFNEDYSQATIRKNGKNSDGLMRDWGDPTYSTTKPENISPFYQYADTLKKVTFDADVKNIGISAFGYCKSLKTVIFNDELVEIRNIAFRHCENLETVTFNKQLEKIGTGAFEYCNSLKTIDIPDNVKTIDSSVFFHCNSLETATIGNGISNISPMSFEYCSSLKTVILPNKTTKIQSQAFRFCTVLENIEFPDTLQVVDYGAFENCRALKKAIMPEACTYIGERAFQSCFALSDVRISSKLEYLGGKSFWGAQFTSFEIPATVHTIEYNPFPNCTKLQNLTVHPDNPYYKMYDGILYEIDKTSIITVPYYCQSTTYTAPSELKRIEAYAFANANKLNNIILNEGLTYIGDYGFYYTGNKATISIPKTVSTIYNTAFFNSQISQINVDDENTRFVDENGTRLYDKNKTTIYKVTLNDPEINDVVTMPDTLTKVTDGAFSRNSNLKGVVLPSSVSSISNDPFSNCKKDTLKIYGTAGSYTETWANKNGFTFVAQ